MGTLYLIVNKYYFERKRAKKVMEVFKLVERNRAEDYKCTKTGT